MVSISWPHDLPTLASQSPGITGMSHFAWPVAFLSLQLSYLETKWEAGLCNAVPSLTIPFGLVIWGSPKIYFPFTPLYVYLRHTDVFSSI